MLEQRFGDWLDLLRPNDVWIAKLNREIRRLWSAEKDRLSGRRQQVASRIQSLEDKIRRFDEAVVEDKIDRETYQENRTRLRAMLSEAKLAEDDCEIGELDLDGVLAFATMLLENPRTLWKASRHAESRKLLAAFFPGGVEVDRDLKFTNRRSRNDSNTYWWFTGAGRSVVDQTGVEPVTS